MQKIGIQRTIMQVKKLHRSKYQFFCDLRDGGYLGQQPDDGAGFYSISDKGKAAAAKFGWI